MLQMVTQTPCDHLQATENSMKIPAAKKFGFFPLKSVDSAIEDVLKKRSEILALKINSNTCGIRKPGPRPVSENDSDDRTFRLNRDVKLNRNSG